MSTALRPGDVAWLALAATIVIYEIAAPREELLSDAADRYRAARPIATHAAIILVAGHLARVWPRRLDPLCWIANLGRRAA